jgi:hypothetical protein
MNRAGHQEGFAMRNRTLSLVLAVFFSLSAAAPLFASPRDFEPRDPISRIVRLIKKILRVAPNDDQMSVPHP